MELLPIARDYANAPNNIPGVNAKLLVARYDKFTTIAEFITPVVAAGDAVTIDDDHTFGVSDGFIELEGDFKINNWAGEPVADWGSNNKKYTYTMRVHGLSAAIEAAVLALNNSEVICLAKKLKTGAASYNQFGLKDMPARCIGAKPTSGTPDGGFAGYELTFEAIQPSLAFYTGLITMEA